VKEERRMRQIQIEDQAPPMVAYIYDPETGRAGQVVPDRGAYVAQVGGRLHIEADPEGAIAAAWLMLERRVLPPPVPVRRGGAA
jgi:hypothetical protein